ncbi:MAG TPA: cytochrome C oxidase subunit I, partial [Burkholderiaceae bacterium]
MPTCQPAARPRAREADAESPARRVFDPAAGAAITRAWLWLGVAALAGAGLLAVLLGLSRTPEIASVLARLAQREWFRLGLVVHVDLSVLV